MQSPRDMQHVNFLGSSALSIRCRHNEGGLLEEPIRLHVLLPKGRDANRGPHGQDSPPGGRPTCSPHDPQSSSQLDR